MTNVIKGAGRRKYEANKRHQQRTDLPPRGDQSRKRANEIVAEEARKIVDEKQGKAAPRPSKAQQLALAAEEAGWKVERIVKGTHKTLIATRDGERLEANWENDRSCVPLGFHEVDGVKQRFQHVTVALKLIATTPEVARQSAKSRSTSRKPIGTATARSVANIVPFDPKVATEPEVMDALLGHKIVWSNSMDPNAEVKESAVIPLNGKQTRLDLDDLADLSTRQISFCDAEGGGYRTVRLSSLLSVSAHREDDGNMLTATMYSAMVGAKMIKAKGEK